MAPERLLAQNALSAPFRPLPGLALALPDTAGEGKQLLLCSEISPGTCSSELSKAAEKLSFCVCGRQELSSLLSGQKGEASPAAAICEKASALPLLALSNIAPGSGFSGALAHRALSSAQGPGTLASAAAAGAEAGGFMGLYAELCLLFPFDRENYLRFMSFLSAEAHKRGLFLLSALECENAAESPGFCSELQSLCDYTVLMSYDYPSRSPTAALPLNLLRRDLESMKGLIKMDKCLLSFSDRALDFTLPRGGVKSMSSLRALELALSAAESIFYEPSSASASFNYRSPDGQSHRVFTPDVRSAAEIYAILNEFRLAGVFFRSSERTCGPEFNYLCSLISAKKYI